MRGGDGKMRRVRTPENVKLLSAQEKSRVSVLFRAIQYAAARTDFGKKMTQYSRIHGKEILDQKQLLRALFSQSQADTRTAADELN